MHCNTAIKPDLVFCRCSRCQGGLELGLADHGQGACPAGQNRQLLTTWICLWQQDRVTTVPCKPGVWVRVTSIVS